MEENSDINETEQPSGWIIRDGLTKKSLAKLSADWGITRDQVVSITTMGDAYVLIFEPTAEQRELERQRQENRTSLKGAFAVGGRRRTPQSYTMGGR